MHKNYAFSYTLNVNISQKKFCYEKGIGFSDSVLKERTIKVSNRFLQKGTGAAPFMVKFTLKTVSDSISLNFHPFFTGKDAVKAKF